MGLLDKLKRKTQDAGASGSASPRKMRKVMVLGLDCAPPQHIFSEYADDIPNLTKLRENGLWGPLDSIVPPITVPAWMCMMT